MPSKQTLLIICVCLTMMVIFFLGAFTDVSSSIAIHMNRLDNSTWTDKDISSVRDLLIGPPVDTIYINRSEDISVLPDSGRPATNATPAKMLGKILTNPTLGTKTASISSKSSPSSSNSQTESMDVPTTKMTFDPNVIVRFHESPFVFCYPQSEKKKPALGNLSRTFKTALLRRPKWMHHWRFDQCRYSNCIYDGTKVTEKTDVVVVYSVGLNDKFQLPPRWKHQLYAIATWESPHHTHAQFLNGPSKWNDKFNLTYTYRVDADIFSPYAKLEFSPKPLKQRPDYYGIAKNKTKSVAWFVSNCKTPSKRDQYAREMQKYIDVDIYGGCGIPCKKGPHSPCMEALPYTYTFYLSFENSLCTDYMSEKIFKLFVPDMHIIPVVRGHSDYDNYFPNNTIINAAHFPNAKTLALYLKQLGSDLKKYSRYLEYKDLYVKTKSSEDRMACNLCNYLHEHEMEPKVYDMKKWMGDNHCLKATDIV